MIKKDNNKMQQSPLKQKQIHQLEENKRDVLNHLDYLFTYYASKFSRHNYRELSHKSYMEMMEKLLCRSDNLISTRTSEDRKIEQQQLKKVQILYYSKGSREGTNFQQFLQLIPGIGHIVYSQLSNKVQQTEMITKDLLNLYRREVEIKITGKFINLDLELESQTMKYILKLAPQFFKIYKAYFYHEFNRNIKKENIKDESMKCFFKFIKEFEVFPKLITAGGICFIYKQVLENDRTELLDQQLNDNLPVQQYKNNSGMVFSLGKFITALVAISKVTNQKIKSNQDQNQNQKDCFRSLLQYIEMTKAYKKQRHLKDTGKSFSFILLQEYPKQLFKQTRVLKDGREVTPKKQTQFIKILKKMEL